MSHMRIADTRDNSGPKLNVEFFFQCALNIDPRQHAETALHKRCNRNFDRLIEWNI